MMPITTYVPATLLSLPESTWQATRSSEGLLSPIIPLLTNKPRPLAAYLQKKGYLARPITWPTVPKGQDRVRICIHAGNTEVEIAGLVNVVLEWIMGQEEAQRRQALSARL